MSGGNPVLVSEMYSPKACVGWGLVHSGAWCPREGPSFNRRSRVLEGAWQVRMACSKDSGLVPHLGQVVSGFWWTQGGCGAR